MELHEWKTWSNCAKLYKQIRNILQLKFFFILNCYYSMFQNISPHVFVNKTTYLELCCPNRTHHYHTSIRQKQIVFSS